MVDATRIREGEAILQKYKEGKALLDKRVVENEEWYKLRHWEQLRAEKNQPQTASAWLFNSLMNKHADIMDNYPQPNLLPREKMDQDDAEALSKIVPVVLEQNDFEETYDSVSMDKLKHGTGVYKIFWDKDKLGGLGDIGIRQVELVNLFWEPGKSDIQESENFFHVELANRKMLQDAYPELEFKGGDSTKVVEFKHSDYIDTTDKCLVVDWYYKVWQGGKQILHYIKFCESQVLYATEDTPGMENGLYDHGLYPYEFDVLFAEKDSPAGFGYVDIMKDAQISIDNIWINFEKNVVWNSTPRYFVKDSAGVNKEQFADVKNSIVNFTGDKDNIVPIQGIPVNGNAIALYQLKIDELKETSSNRDFSQGGTASGVTAASAIAALQEAGNKTSRDMIKASYRSFTRIVRMVVELIRQFYDQPREFRITGKDGDEFVKYSNANIKPADSNMVMGVEMGGRKPVFDIKITSQKASPFSKVAQNELLKELFAMGLFNPEIADQALIVLEGMDFEGKEEIIRKVSANGAMMRQMLQMQIQIAEMAMAMDKLTGGNMSGAVGGQPINDPNMPAAGGTSGKKTEVNALGEAYKTSKNNTVDKARENAQNRTAVK
ncbi:portal protein [Anaerotignum sp.]